MNISTYLNLYFPQFEPALKAEIMERGNLKLIAEGEKVLQAGQKMRSALLIASGRLRFYRQTESGNELLLYEILAGDACALSMAITPGLYTSTTMAIASEESLLIMVPIFYTETWMEKYRTWNNFVVGTFRKRFEEMVSTVDQVAFKKMDERLLDYLSDQRKKTGSDKIFVTHRKIASDLNSSREVISRLLKKMENGKKLKLFRNHLELSPPAVL